MANDAEGLLGNNNEKDMMMVDPNEAEAQRKYDATLIVPEVVTIDREEEERRLDLEVLEDEPGLKSWVNVFGGFLVSFICYGMTNSFGIFQAYYENNQLSSTSAANISWIGSIQLCLVLLLGSVSGPLFDAGYLKSLLAVGGILYVVCLMLTSIATEYYQFILSQGLGVGLGMGLIFSPALSTVGQHFGRSKHRTVAFGIFSVGASIGGVVFPIVLRVLLDNVGFGWAVRILAFMVFACGSCASLLLSARLPPKKDILILSPSVFRHPTYTLLVIGCSAIAAGLYGPVSFGVTYAEAHGFDQSLAFYSLSILNATSALGRIIPSFLARYTGPINVLIVACTLSSIMLFCWTTATTIPAILTYNAFYGLVSGGYIASFPPSITSLDIDPGRTGLYLGMGLFTTSFFWLASGPVCARLIGVGVPAGTALNDSRIYLPASIYCGVIVAVGVGFMLAARRLRMRVTKSWRA